MSQPDPLSNFITEATNTIAELTEGLNSQIQNLLEQTTVVAGQTMEGISSNPILKSADQIIGLDSIMTFLGQVDVAKIEATVNKMRSQYPEETPSQIAHRLIVEKAWDGGKIGLLSNAIPPIAALFLGVELIATAKLQTEMVYEIAKAYGLDLQEPARRGEVLAIFGLSLGADVLKTGLSIVEIIPGIGAVVGASTNAAMLYVLGRTARRFYASKIDQTQLISMQQESDADWQVALNQSKIMDRILTYMVKISYPTQDWTEILPQIKEISPSSVATIATNLQQSENLSALLEQLMPEFGAITLSRCYNIARSTGEITSAEQEVLNQIALKFDLDMSALGDK